MPIQGRPYLISLEALESAPSGPGVYALYSHDTVVYYGYAARLREHLESYVQYDGDLDWHREVTHFAWEASPERRTRHGRLLMEYASILGRLPIGNQVAAERAAG